VCGTRYGQGRCTVLWISVDNGGWMLLPHGVPALSVHLAPDEFTSMLNKLQEKM
jgi:hypothetical protein